MKSDRARLGFADATTAAYGFGLGLSSVALPLLALDAGYSASHVGVLTAVSAVGQIVVRLYAGAALRRYPDRTPVIVASGLLSVSFLSIAASTGLTFFVIAQLAQGASRAAFWTGMQSHVARGDRPVSRSLARNLLIANFGLLLGPVAAGFALEVSMGVPLLLGAAVGGVATGLSLGMTSLPPFPASMLPARSPMRRRPAVVTGGVAAGVAGTWQGLLGSYVPVVLGQAGLNPGSIGVLVSVAVAANSVSAAGLARVRLRNVPRALVVSCGAVALGTAALGAVGSSGAVAAVCLVVSGLGAGVLQILGSAVASESVHREERGQAIAVTGTVRAGMMFGSPLTVAGLLQVASMQSALALVGLLLLVPTGVLHRRRDG